jgi:hypothetical protein
MLLLVIQFFLFTSTFADFVISSLPDAETAGKYPSFPANRCPEGAFGNLKR